MSIYIENWQESVEFEGSALDFYNRYKNKLPKKTLTITNNGKLIDWREQLKPESNLEFIDFEKEEGKYVFWHSSAHILAQAILRHYPKAKPTIGPPIKEGFYYDFADLHFSENDFEKIEKEMEKIINERYEIIRLKYQTLKEASNQFKENKYKQELIEEFKENLTSYQQGEFIDLCRGPHLINTGIVKSVKLLKTSGSYWRGDTNEPSLTRIYGISFPTKNLLDQFLHRREEALKRDHRLIGKRLDLFSFQPEAQGIPFIHHKGMIIYQEMMRFWKELHDEYDYQEIKTPGVMNRKLWEKSGHWKNFLSNMYTFEIDEEDYAIKPMNCPGCCIYFNSKQISYRQLPLRIAEIGTVYRHELSGALAGLFRVRSFTQDDSHLFMSEDQIEDEVEKIIELSAKIYQKFGLKWHLELSTRPEKSIGNDKIWELATESLYKVLKKLNLEFKVNEGDGAFYGPKIDFHLEDIIGRSWQCGTIQLDMNLPEKFNVEYTSEEGKKKRPVMLHRTIYGSIERFLAIIIEQYGGKFPLWLSPVHARIIPIQSSHIGYAKQIEEKLKENGLRVEVDLSQESFNKKIRNSQLSNTNYSIIIGDKELQNKNIAVRLRTNKNLGAIDIDKFCKELKIEYSTKRENSIFN